MNTSAHAHFAAAAVLLTDVTKSGPVQWSHQRCVSCSTRRTTKKQAAWTRIRFVQEHNFEQSQIHLIEFFLAIITYLHTCTYAKDNSVCDWIYFLL